MTDPKKKFLRIDVIASAVGIAAIVGGGFYKFGAAEVEVDVKIWEVKSELAKHGVRVSALELAEERGIPRKGARKEFEKIDKRLDKLESGQGVIKEKARSAEEQRRAIKEGVDRIIKRLDKKDDQR